jgi:signal transduction histidine kinase
VIPITRRMALLVTTAAMLPLLIFGVVAGLTLRATTRQSVMENHAAIAARAADSIALYLTSTERLVRSAASDLMGTGLTPAQQRRVLFNHVTLTREIKSITLYDTALMPVVSSDPGPGGRAPLTERPKTDFSLLPVDLDADGLPRTRMTVRLDEALTPYLVAELRLEELWTVVDNVKVGVSGRAFVVDELGRIIADGRQNGKGRIARGERIGAHPLAAAKTAAEAQYRRADGADVVTVSTAPDARVGWRVIVEQKTDNAFAPARELERQLLLFVTLALLANIGIGIAFGRSLLRPISDLLNGIRAIGEGDLDQRVHITRDDEFRLLGDAFNATADKLGELQQAAIRQERQAMFGRIAAGLVHDLSHPIQNINNNCKLVLQMHDDAEYRATFAKLVKREFSTIQRTFEDLRNLARPIPLEKFPVDAGKLMIDVVERMQAQASVAGVMVSGGAIPTTPLYVEGDLFALGRVLRNLVLNALQATAPGGRVWIEVEGDDRRVQIAVCDTGCGIPADRIQAIFEDFVTTKRRGLGLGLAISRKIVEQLGGTITVASTVGDGSRFTLTFPRLTRITTA